MYFGACYLNSKESQEVQESVLSVLVKHRATGELDQYYTKDNPELQKWDSHYLFVYGAQKAGFKRHAVLENQPIAGVGYTKHALYTLYHYDKFIDKTFIDRYPVCLINSGSDKAHIYGEVYQVSAEKIRNLDYLESNGTIYKRIKVACNIQSIADKQVRTVSCFMYAGDKSYWEKQFNYLARCDKLVANKNQNFVYYSYMKRYEQEIAA